MLDILNHIGLVAFALSGVLTAANRKLDLLGAYTIAFITALGGGTVRDLLLTEQVAWMQSFSEIMTVGIAATFGILFRNTLRKWRRTLFIFDAIGISVFTIVGVQKGLNYNQLYIISLFLGMMTATFGGMIRDVLCNEIPLIFREELYAIPCLVGGSIYLLGSYFDQGDTVWLLWSSMAIIAIFRTLAVKFSWKSPMPTLNKSK